NPKVRGSNPLPLPSLRRRSSTIRKGIANASPLRAGSWYRSGSGRPAEVRSMDLRTVREEAIEATTRAFWDKNGFVPDEDSDEWEAEYRRQFEQVKRRHATGQVTEVRPSLAASAPPEEGGWAVLTGAPTQIRWAAALRADRIREIKDPGIRHWLV